MRRGDYKVRQRASREYQHAAWRRVVLTKHKKTYGVAGAAIIQVVGPIKRLAAPTPPIRLIQFIRGLVRSLHMDQDGCPMLSLRVLLAIFKVVLIPTNRDGTAELAEKTCVASWLFTRYLIAM